MPRKRAAKPVTTLMPHSSPQLTGLLEAAKTCRIEHVRRFLAAGGLPDTLVELKFVDGTSVMAPLIFKAISTHHMVQDPALHHASLELLLQSGANANGICIIADGEESTALILASNVPCCTAPVRLLLAHGANPALQTSTGEAALHSAARAGRVDVCKMILEAGGCEPDVSDCNGVTPVSYAVQQGYLQVVGLLHKQWSADLFRRQSNGATLLHVAAKAGQSPMLEYLLHNGLDVNAVMAKAMTPACIAAQAGYTEAVQTLLKHGASTTAVDDRGHSLLMVAVKTAQTSVVELLLSKRDMHSNQRVDVNAAAADGRTALHIAACEDRTDAAALLLQHGAAVNATDENNFTPLVMAAATSSAELVQLLLNAAAVITEHSPALHAAVLIVKQPEVLKLLVEQARAAAALDIAVSQCECCGPRTAVMMCEHPAFLKLLLAAGADVHKTTDRGNTALHVATVHKFAAPVLCLLIKAGVDLHAVNSDGKTAAQVAADTGNTLAAALLTRAARDT
jgi:ankyrin repeat protein